MKKWTEGKAKGKERRFYKTEDPGDSTERGVEVGKSDERRSIEVTKIEDWRVY